MTWLIAAAIAAPLSTCEQVYDTRDLREGLDAAEQSVRPGEQGQLGREVNRVRARVGCFGEPLAADELARLNLLEALLAYGRGDEEGVVAALAAVVAAKPSADLPTTLVAVDHPIRARLEDARRRLDSPPQEPLRVVRSGWFEVDGQHQTRVPSNRNVVVQLFGDDGRPVETRFYLSNPYLADWAQYRRLRDDLAWAASPRD